MSPANGRKAICWCREMRTPAKHPKILRLRSGFWLAARMPRNRLNKIPRLRSGFRLRAPARLAASLTPAKRLNFTKKGPHAVGPLEPLIAKGLPLSGTLAAGFVSARRLDFKELSPLALQNPYAFVCPQRLQRLNFTKTGMHSVLPFETLISLGLGANGSGTDWFDPFVLASAALQGRL